MSSRDHPHAPPAMAVPTSTKQVFTSLRPLKSRLKIGHTIYMTNLCFHEDDVTHEFTSGESGGSGKEEAGRVDQLQSQTPLAHQGAPGGGSGPRPGTSTPHSTPTTTITPSPSNPPTPQGKPLSAAQAAQINREATTSQPIASAGPPPARLSYAGITAKGRSPVPGLASVGTPPTRPAGPYAGIAALAKSRAGVERTTGGGTPRKHTSVPTGSRAQAAPNRSTGSTSNAPQPKRDVQPDTSKKRDMAGGRPTKRHPKRLSSRLTEAGQESKEGTMLHYAIVLAMNDETITLAATATFGGKKRLPESLPRKSIPSWVSVNGTMEEGMIHRPITNNNKKVKWVNVRQWYVFPWDAKHTIETRSEKYEPNVVEELIRIIKANMEKAQEGQAGDRSEAPSAQSG